MNTLGAQGAQGGGVALEDLGAEGRPLGPESGVGARKFVTVGDCTSGGRAECIGGGGIREARCFCKETQNLISSGQGGLHCGGTKQGEEQTGGAELLGGKPLLFIRT